MSLSGKENAIFRPLMAAAWRVHVERTGMGLQVTDKQAFARWKHDQYWQLGIATTRALAPGDVRAFDRLCLHFATLAGDEASIAYWARAEERRALHRLDMTLQATGKTRAYAEGIARAMRLFAGAVKSLEELPAEHVLKVNAAVDKQRRRNLQPAPCAEKSDVPF